MLKVRLLLDRDGAPGGQVRIIDEPMLAALPAIGMEIDIPGPNPRTLRVIRVVLVPNPQPGAIVAAVTVA